MPQPAIVIARFGQQVLIADQQQHYHVCKTRQNAASLVAGDQVSWQIVPPDTKVIIEALPRKNVLARPHLKKPLQPVAANLDQLAIVVCCEPAPSTTTIDRYLVMAETLAIKPILIFNKSDLLAQHPNWLAIFQLYQQLGYAWVFNTTDGPPSAALIKLLKQQSTLLVGQSGVGKSSLIRQLIPNIEVQIGAINQNTHLGRHTTTVTRLYYLPNGGYLIDSPGIRQFDVNHLNATQIAYGFKEFRPFLGQCKFRNCLHEQDLGCALLAALNQGNISSRRYAIFKTLVQQSREFRLV